MGAEAGDARRQGDASAPMLLGEGPGEEAPAALVGGGEEPVDGTVDLSGGAVRLILASQALASVRGRSTVLVGHRSLPPSEKPPEREGHRRFSRPLNLLISHPTPAADEAVFPGVLGL